uniref:Fam-b protein n=1 Tax=Rhabditophanes sp. KR3021 TaxID=114890 RepID=A0AC35TIU3_9BILA
MRFSLIFILLLLLNVSCYAEGRPTTEEEEQERINERGHITLVSNITESLISEIDNATNNNLIEYGSREPVYATTPASTINHVYDLTPSKFVPYLYAVSESSFQEFNDFKEKMCLSVDRDVNYVDFMDYILWENMRFSNALIQIMEAPLSLPVLNVSKEERKENTKSLELEMKTTEPLIKKIKYKLLSAAKLEDNCKPTVGEIVGESDEVLKAELEHHRFDDLLIGIVYQVVLDRDKYNKVYMNDIANKRK